MAGKMRNFTRNVFDPATNLPIGRNRKLANMGEKQIPGAWGSTPRSEFVRMIEELEGNINNNVNGTNTPEWHDVLAGYKRSLSDADNSPSMEQGNNITDIPGYGENKSVTNLPISTRGSKNLSQLAPEELKEEIEKLIYRDQRKVSNLPYSKYPGSTISPMSTMTQKARELREQQIGKPLPYSKKINSVLARTEPAVSNQTIDDVLQGIGTQQSKFSQDKVLGKLQRKFNGTYTPERVNRFNEKQQKDLDVRNPEIAQTARTLASDANINEETRKHKLVDTFATLGANKTDRRNTLIGELDRYGNQKHHINNAVSAGEEAKFKDEQNWPRERLELLKAAAGGTNINEGNLPEVNQHQAQDLAKALQAYGIDTSKPVDQWDTSRLEKGAYPGELIAGINPELQASYNLIENISPKYRDQRYAETKQLQKELLTQPSSGARAFSGALEQTKPTMNLLESQQKQKLKEELRALGGKYIKLGHYGSPVHMAEAEKIARKLNDSTLDRRSDTVLKNARDNIGSYDKDSNLKMERLAVNSALGKQEHNNMFADVRDINDLGKSKWKNKQKENEDLYKNYRNERAWEWPAMRAEVMKTGHQKGYAEGIPVGHSQGYGKASSEAQAVQAQMMAEQNQLRAKHSEYEKETGNLRTQIGQRDSTINKYNNDINQYKNQITSNETHAKQLAQEKAQIQALLAGKSSYIAPAVYNDLAQKKKQIEDELAQANNQAQTLKNQYAGYVPPQTYQQTLADYQEQLKQKQHLTNLYATYVHPSSYQQLMNDYNIVKQSNNANYDSLAKTPGSRMEFHKRF